MKTKYDQLASTFKPHPNGVVLDVSGVKLASENAHTHNAAVRQLEPLALALARDNNVLPNATHALFLPPPTPFLSRVRALSVYPVSNHLRWWQLPAQFLSSPAWKAA